VEGARSSSSSSLNRLKRENDALKTLLLELAADRQAAQARLTELQERMADLASVSVTGSMLGEVRGGGAGVTTMGLPAATASLLPCSCCSSVMWCGEEMRGI
jgi:hypothetical protein